MLMSALQINVLTQRDIIPTLFMWLDENCQFQRQRKNKAWWNLVPSYKYGFNTLFLEISTQRYSLKYSSSTESTIHCTNEHQPNPAEPNWPDDSHGMPKFGLHNWSCVVSMISNILHMSSQITKQPWVCSSNTRWQSYTPKVISSSSPPTTSTKSSPSPAPTPTPPVSSLSCHPLLVCCESVGHIYQALWYLLENQQLKCLRIQYFQDLNTLIHKSES